MRKGLIDQIKFLFVRGGTPKADWLRKKKKFALMGEHVLYQPMKYPLDGSRLKFITM